MATDGYIVALDYGDRRIGVAAAHTVARLPRPICTLENNSSVIADIRASLEGEHLVALVIGLPRNMDGSLGPQAEKCRQFGTMAGEQLAVPVHFVEETLSSIEASAYMQDPAARKTGLDAVAAACILERYLSEGEGNDG